MKTLLIVGLIALVGLAECTTIASIYDVRPNNVILNDDWSQTLEFLFPLENYDPNMAAQWVIGYLDNKVRTSEAAYEEEARKWGWKGPPFTYRGIGDLEAALTQIDILNVSSRIVERGYGSEAGVKVIGGICAGYAPDYSSPNTKNAYVSILVQVRPKYDNDPSISGPLLQ